MYSVLNFFIFLLHKQQHFLAVTYFLKIEKCYENEVKLLFSICHVRWVDRETVPLFIMREHVI